MKKGYFQITTEAEYDVYIEDTIDNLDSFNDNDLTELSDELAEILDERFFRKDNSVDDSKLELIPDNLYDEEKIKIIKDIYNRMNLEDLQKLQKQLK